MLQVCGPAANATLVRQLQPVTSHDYELSQPRQNEHNLNLNPDRREKSRIFAGPGRKTLFAVTA